MTRLASVAVLFGLFAGAGACAADDSSAQRVPVLMELFTSEGCSDCPPADRFLAQLDQEQPVVGADLIVLGEHVDYWNRQGWADLFSSPAYGARQQQYTNRYGLNGVYTPQLVVDGRFGLVGSDRRGALSAIQKTIREPKIPMALSIAAHVGSRVTARIELPSWKQVPGAGHAILYVVIADNRAQSHVESGENRGRDLAHVAVALVLIPVGRIKPGKAAAREATLAFSSGPSADGSRVVAFLQDDKSGRVLAVAEWKF